MERLERFDDNMRFASQRTVWQWCSRLLRPAWARKTFGRIDILVAITPVFGFTYQELNTLGVNILAGIPLTEDFILNLMDADPATLLYLALHGIQLEDIRERFSRNRRLDTISKITLAQEERYGDAWDEEGLHPFQLIKEWETASGPLKSALTLRFFEHQDYLTELLQELIPGDPIQQSFEAAYLQMAASRTSRLRETPPTLLNLATRLKLRNIFDRAPNTIYLEELFEHLLAALPPATMASIEHAGYAPADVIADFLCHDTRIPRRTFLSLDTGPRPHLP